jgi:hypothetical protein
MNDMPTRLIKPCIAMIFALAVSFIPLGLCGQQLFTMPHLSQGYDVEMTVTCESEVCNGEGTVRLLRKNTHELVQEFFADELFFIARMPMKPDSTGSIMIPHDYEPILIDDINFDGIEDIAIPNGRQSLENARFDVYLFHAQSKKFILDSGLTALSGNYEGRWTIDKSKKTLSFMRKDVTTITIAEYAWIGAKPCIIYKSEESRIGNDWIELIETTYRTLRGKQVIAKVKKQRLKL